MMRFVLSALKLAMPVCGGGVVAPSLVPSAGSGHRVNPSRLVSLDTVWWPFPVLRGGESCVAGACNAQPSCRGHTQLLQLRFGKACFQSCVNAFALFLSIKASRCAAAAAAHALLNLVLACECTGAVQFGAFGKLQIRSLKGFVNWSRKLILALGKLGVASLEGLCIFSVSSVRDVSEFSEGTSKGMVTTTSRVLFRVGCAYPVGTAWCSVSTGLRARRRGVKTKLKVSGFRPGLGGEGTLCLGGGVLGAQELSEWAVTVCGVPVDDYYWVFVSRIRGSNGESVNVVGPLNVGAS